MKRLQDFVDRHLGVAGVAGATLLAACAAFYYAGFGPAQAERDLLHAELARSERNAGEGGLPARGGEEALAQFYGYFGARQQASAALRMVFDAARAEGLATEIGEYRLARDQATKLLRYQIVLPIKGPYIGVRRFIVRALNEVPGLALESFDVRRESLASSAVEARVQLTLYLGDG